MRILNKSTIAIEVDYINKILKGKKRGLNRIAPEDYNVTDKEILELMEQLGYRRVKNQFIEVGQEVIPEVGQEVIPEVGQEVIPEVGQVTNQATEPTEPIEDKYITEVVQASTKDDTSLVVPTEIEEKMFGLIKHYDALIALAEQHNKGNSFSDGNIVIELPSETVANYKTSIRVNNVVWEQFSEFCKTNNIFDKKDLLSMSLLEYMQKYNRL